jgi:hypothetical protein
MDFAAGTRVGPYEIVALIGRGGMGGVYPARDTGETKALLESPALKRTRILPSPYYPATSTRGYDLRAYVMNWLGCRNRAYRRTGSRHSP